MDLLASTLRQDLTESISLGFQKGRQSTRSRMASPKKRRRCIRGETYVVGVGRSRKQKCQMERHLCEAIRPSKKEIRRGFPSHELSMESSRENK